MIAPTSVSPTVHLCPIGATQDDQHTELSIADDDEVVDGKLAVTNDPIVGIERVVYDDATGSGALPARPLTAPKGMSMSQRAIHDLTHLPYDPSCEVCVSCRRPNTHHRSVSSSERSVPLMVGDYAFPKHSDETEPLTVLVIRVYPYNMFYVVSSLPKDEIQWW